MSGGQIFRVVSTLLGYYHMHQGKEGWSRGNSADAVWFSAGKQGEAFSRENALMYLLSRDMIGAREHVTWGPRPVSAWQQ